MTFGTLGSLVALLAVTVLTVGVLRRARLPAILAYLFTGLLVGPHGLGWISDNVGNRLLAEFGVVFLLFTLGLEFSLPKLMAMKREVLVLGGSQVAATTLFATLVAWLIGTDAEPAVVLGGALAMSSTAIVIKQLGEQLELSLPHGRLSIGVLLFQDLAVIPFLILIAAFANPADTAITVQLGIALGKAVLAFGIVVAVGRWLLRPLFHEIAHARSAELFTLAVLFVTLGAAAVTHWLGLSYALGAFLAGMMLGETEFRHQVEADIRPFRDVLLGLFFITVGMLLDIGALRDVGGTVAFAVAAFILFKAISITLLARLLTPDWSEALRTGLVLAQGGEFGFALLALALTAGVITPEVGQPVLVTIVISMIISPLLIRHNGAIAARLFPVDARQERETIEHDIAQHHLGMRDHVIICGYGRVGQNVARFLEQEGFDYVALDLDPQRVRLARAAGDPVYYGDATRRDILEAADVAHARILVIAYYDVATALKILREVKALRPDLPVLVRTRDDSRLEELQAAGATEVIPETLEASLMVASHLLLLLKVPMTRIVRRIQEVRANRYSLLRNVFRGQDARPMDETHAFREQLQTIELAPGARAIGKTIGELGLDQLGIMVTAVRREGIVGRQPAPETLLKEGDVLVLYGKPEDLEHSEELLLG
ncbi:MAG TPA: monovalent cation:proton antiporter-2 (CPA2) family protein [Gammaproteobacteria bacterium]|nr:monovalent cation:proton antiporter-2 (CPA2) family protein [Gammaproteobacteria bacterium]